MLQAPMDFTALAASEQETARRAVIGWYLDHLTTGACGALVRLLLLSEQASGPPVPPEH